MNITNKLNRFTDLTYYKTHFMNPRTWEPYVCLICQRHGIQCDQVRQGIPGTFPTFVIEPAKSGQNQDLNAVVLKFFGPLFDGSDSFLIERNVGHWLKTHPMPIPSPAILAEGKLEDNWQYLVFEYVPGVSVGEARAELEKIDFLQAACQIGETLCRLHKSGSAQNPEIGPSIRISTSAFRNFLDRQHHESYLHHQSWNDLPNHLLSELEHFILPVEKLIDPDNPPHLIHADLTADHVLGRFESGRWQTLAIIDWGDARTGNILYELVALQMDLFQGDLDLLSTCLEAYKLPNFYQDDFTHKALSMALLHQFPLPAWVNSKYKDVHSLDELAEQLFGY